MTFYSKAGSVAERMLAKFGRDMVLRKADTFYKYNPARGLVEHGPTGEFRQEYTAKGIRLDYTQSEVDGTRIKQGDARIYLDPSLEVEPKTGDTVEIDTQCYQVIASKTLNPAGTVVLYEVQVRGVQ